MDIYLIFELLNYLNFQAITLCGIRNEASLWEITAMAPAVQMTRCIENFIGKNTSAQEIYQPILALESLIVCEDISTCIALFQSIVKQERNSLTVLSKNSNFIWKNISSLRYDDTILDLNEATSHITELYGYNDFVFEASFGSWNKTSKNLTVPAKYKWERRIDMEGQVLRSSIWHWFPMSIKTTKEDDQVQWSGFSIEVLETLGAKLNFTIEYKSPADGLWGIKVS